MDNEPKLEQKAELPHPFPIAYLQKTHGEFYTREAVANWVQQGRPRFVMGGCSSSGSARFYPTVPSIGMFSRKLDFSKGLDEANVVDGEAAVGVWNEHRSGMQIDGRSVHMGVDLCGRAGDRVHAFFKGTIFLMGSSPDQGNVMVTKHDIDGYDIYAFHGHLSAKSLEGKTVGQTIKRGEEIGWMGSKAENGGLFAHVHFQLSMLQPVVAVIPDMVALEHRDIAKAIYPDPRLILGPIF